MRTKKEMMLYMSLLLMFLCCSYGKAQTLVLWHADGTTTDVALYTRPQVMFQDDKIIITSTVLDMEYSKDNVLRFTYKGGSTAITFPTDKTNVSQEGDQLVFYGVNDNVSVYTVSGIRVPIAVTRRGNTATLPLSAIPSGVYLLNVNGKTSKFTKP